MSSYTLDDIRAAADKKYGSTDIAVDENTVVRLLNPLRLPKTVRDELLALQSEAKDGVEEVDQGDVFRQSLRLVAHNQEVAVERLIEAVGDDIAMLASIFEAYTNGTDAGEASASAN